LDVNQTGRSQPDRYIGTSLDLQEPKPSAVLFVTGQLERRLQGQTRRRSIQNPASGTSSTPVAER
jgi:hypothetical protein